MELTGYVGASDVSFAVTRSLQDPLASYIAGGTDVLQLLREGVRRPSELVDVSRVLPDSITSGLDGVRIGAGARLADVAADPILAERYAAVSQALRETASPQVRNMATIGGNLLQSTRCPYFRDPETPCNRREPGSGCSAMEGVNRHNAIFGGSRACIAAYPGDLATALVALDAELVVRGYDGERTIALEDLHRLPGDTPEIETVLRPGDLIMSVFLPLASAGRRSLYLKMRDRTSFQWPVVSAAVALAHDGETIHEARIAVGGVATKPWRLRRVEEALAGRPLEAASLEAASLLAGEGADPRPDNAFKVVLVQRLVLRALRQVGGVA